MQTLDLVLGSIGTPHDDSVLYLAKVSATAHLFSHDPRWSELYQRVSSETDDVTVHGMQKISHVTLTLFHSRAAKSQKKKALPVTALLDCSICLSLHLQSISWQNMKSVKHAFFGIALCQLVIAACCRQSFHDLYPSSYLSINLSVQPSVNPSMYQPNFLSLSLSPSLPLKNVKKHVKNISSKKFYKFKL